MILLGEKRNKEPKAALQENYSFLGMALDRILNWDDHIDRVRAKANKALKLWYFLAHIVPKEN